jgi:hypothetical protein
MSTYMERYQQGTTNLIEGSLREVIGFTVILPINLFMNVAKLEHRVQCTLQ